MIAILIQMALKVAMKTVTAKARMMTPILKKIKSSLEMTSSIIFKSQIPWKPLAFTLF